MSKRHDLVTKILRTSFVFAAFFGASSVFYALTESRLSKSLENESALSALRVTLAIDKISLKKEIVESEIECDQRNIKDCNSYIKSLVKAKNRIKDYKLLLVKTLGYSPQSAEVMTLEEQRREIDGLTKHQFGLSLGEAKKKNIISIDQFIDHISQKQKSLNWSKTAENHAKLSEVFAGSIRFLNDNVVTVENIDKSTYSTYQHLRKAFFILIFVEIMVFTLVNFADILNNNADPEEVDKINLRKLQAKTKPLITSISLAFICLLIGQLLLYRESERSLIGNCREINRQNISLMASLDAYPAIKNKSTIIPLMKQSPNCLKFIEALVGNDVRKLNDYAPNTEQLKLEIQKMKLRKYADGYQDKGSELNRQTSNLLLSILITNVASLLALSVFLRQDSEEIG